MLVSQRSTFIFFPFPPFPMLVSLSRSTSGNIFSFFASGRGGSGGVGGREVGRGGGGGHETLRAPVLLLLLLCSSSSMQPTSNSVVGSIERRGRRIEIEMGAMDTNRPPPRCTTTIVALRIHLGEARTCCKCWLIRLSSRCYFFTKLSRERTMFLLLCLPALVLDFLLCQVFF